VGTHHDVPRRHSRKNPKLVASVNNFVLRYNRVLILDSALKHGVHKTAMKVKTVTSKGGKVVLSNGKTISHAELEKEADQWASGEIQVKTIRQLVGRPRLGEDIGKVMPIRIEPSLISEIDRRAKREGISRSALVRVAIAKYLAS
jgi:predicted transcriptional regulator